jgi:hypothetical protein
LRLLLELWIFLSPCDKQPLDITVQWDEAIEGFEENNLENYKCSTKQIHVESRSPVVKKLRSVMLYPTVLAHFSPITTKSKKAYC